MEEQDVDIVPVEEREIVRRGPYKKTKKKTTFLKPKGHDLDKAIKQGGRYLARALETLIFLAIDKEIDPKERRQAAESIIKLHKDMVMQRDKDEIERLTKEIDLLKMIGQGTTDHEEEDDENAPELRFDKLHPDFDDNEVEDVDFEEKS